MASYATLCLTAETTQDIVATAGRQGYPDDAVKQHQWDHSSFTAWGRKDHRWDVLPRTQGGSDIHLILETTAETRGSAYED